MSTFVQKIISFYYKVRKFYKNKYNIGREFNQQKRGFVKNV